jgi:hypothetical protein
MAIPSGVAHIDGSFTNSFLENSVVEVLVLQLLVAKKQPIVTTPIKNIL